MSKNYPKKFDTSNLSENEKKILADFSERRRLFDEQIQQQGIHVFTCPSCGYPIFKERGDNDICSICHWEDDNQDDPEADEIWGGPNSDISLTQSRLQAGKLLQELTKNLNGTLKLDLEEVMKIINTYKKAVESFLEVNEKITGTAERDHPIWKEYDQLEKNLLTALVKKQ